MTGRSGIGRGEALELHARKSSKVCFDAGACGNRQRCESFVLKRRFGNGNAEARSMWLRRPEAEAGRSGSREVANEAGLTGGRVGWKKRVLGA